MLQIKDGTRMLCRRKEEEGFTLIEVLIAIVLSMAITLVFIAIFRVGFYAIDFFENRKFSDVYMLFSEVKRDVVLAKSISIGPNSIAITKFDGCTVVYEMVGERIEKNHIGTCNETRKLFVENVEVFSVIDDLVPSTYILTVKKIDESFTHTLKVRMP